MFPAPPSNAFKPNDWNRFEALVDADILRVGVNPHRPAGYNDGTAGLEVATDGNGGNFGPVALYVGGTGEVRFKESRDQGPQRADHADREESRRGSARSTSRTSTTAGRWPPATSTTTACST